MKLLLLPLLLVVGLVAIVAVWVWTGPIFALLAFAALCSLGASFFEWRRRRELGLDPKD